MWLGHILGTRGSGFESSLLPLKDSAPACSSLPTSTVHLMHGILQTQFTGYARDNGTYEASDPQLLPTLLWH